jgi:hypothetical protein
MVIQRQSQKFRGAGAEVPGTEPSCPLPPISFLMGAWGITLENFLKLHMLVSEFKCIVGNEFDTLMR